MEYQNTKNVLIDDDLMSQFAGVKYAKEYPEYKMDLILPKVEGYCVDYQIGKVYQYENIETEICDAKELAIDRIKEKIRQYLESITDKHKKIIMWRKDPFIKSYKNFMTYTMEYIGICSIIIIPSGNENKIVLN